MERSSKMFISIRGSFSNGFDGEKFGFYEIPVEFETRFDCEAL